VRIKLLQHAFDGVLDEHGPRDVLDVVTFHDVQDLAEALERLEIVLAHGLAGQRGHGQDEQEQQGADPKEETHRICPPRTPESGRRR